MAAAAMFEVEVIDARGERPVVHRLRLPPGSTVADALAAAACRSQPEPLLLTCFGRLVKADTVLAEGDRVELLRPLLADPKDQRHQRVRAAVRARRRAANS